MLGYLSHGRRARIGDSVARHSCVYLCVKLKSLIRRVIIANRPSRVRVCSKVQGALKSVSWGCLRPPENHPKTPPGRNPTNLDESRRTVKQKQLQSRRLANYFWNVIFTFANLTHWRTDWHFPWPWVWAWGQGGWHFGLPPVSRVIESFNN